VESRKDKASDPRAWEVEVVLLWGVFNQCHLTTVAGTLDTYTSVCKSLEIKRRVGLTKIALYTSE